MKRIVIAAAVAVTLGASPALAEWTVEKSEDPFAPAGTSTFIAREPDDSYDTLAIACENGRVALALVLVGVSGDSVGDTADVKLIADAKLLYEVAWTKIGAVNIFATTVVFGQPATLDYLKGAQKVFVHYTLKEREGTVSFAGGKSMDDAIDGARKACDMAPTPAVAVPKPQPKEGQPCMPDAPNGRAPQWAVDVENRPGAGTPITATDPIWQHAICDYRLRTVKWHLPGEDD